MIKLLLCVVSGIVVAALVLQMRQQRLELNYRVNQLHDEIEAQQGKLWNQQMQIAVYTSPPVVANRIDSLDIKLVPRMPKLPAGQAAPPPPPAKRHAPANRR